MIIIDALRTLGQLGAFAGFWAGFLGLIACADDNSLAPQITLGGLGLCLLGVGLGFLAELPGWWARRNAKSAMTTAASGPTGFVAPLRRLGSRTSLELARPGGSCKGFDGFAYRVIVFERL